MPIKKLILCLGLLLGGNLPSDAQTYVPPNIDFETGTLTNWKFYGGSVSTGFIYSLTTTTPLPGLHTLTSGTGTDAYGGFPEVGIGAYSLKINRDTNNYNTDAASYNIAVPGTSTYSLIYQYAAVLQDPGHMPSHQPVLEVQAIDSTTGTVFFDSIIYPPTPGFTTSTVTPLTTYKAWTNVTVDLSAYSGQTVTMKFFAAACSDGGHWGYAYIDVGALFETSTMLALHAPTVALKGPAGYAAYKWTDAATFTASYGTTASVTLTAPAVKTKYALILTPAAGHGTIDTVYTTVDIASTLSTGTLNINTGLNIYPNPTTGIMNINWTNQQAGTAKLQVADVTGRVVHQSVLNLNAADGQQQINLGGIPDGIYSVSVRSDVINYTSKVAVQK